MSRTGDLPPSPGDLRPFLCLLAGLALLPAHDLHAQSTPPKANPQRLAVDVQARPTTAYVGQGIVLAVGVVGELERPAISTPRIEGADVVLLRTQQVPMSVSSIGDMVRERSLFRFLFIVVPRRSGALHVPPLEARLGSLTGRGQPLALTVRPVPVAGRPATFLGGVGRFDIEARVEPAAVRVGETAELRVVIRGPGARGVTRGPDLARLSRSPLGLQVEELAGEVSDQAPSRTFRYRLRPTHVGSSSLPGLPISGFDAETARFETKLTPTLPFRVEDVPRFDPARLEYGGSNDPSAQPRGLVDISSRVAAASGLALSLAACAVAWIRFRRRRRLPRALARWGAETSRRVASADGPAEVGRALTEALGIYIGLAEGRPLEALTPTEAEEAIARITDDPGLGERARALVARCDGARFAEESGSRPEDLARDGLRLVGDLTRAARTPSPETPREAADHSPTRG